jgi:hypothetical protein
MMKVDKRALAERAAALPGHPPPTASPTSTSSTIDRELKGARAS